jgi:hypothetical protein
MTCAVYPTRLSRTATGRLLCVFILLAIIALHSVDVAAQSPTTYYLATNGSDSNPGTQSAPFRTFSRSLPKLRPGDTLIVRGGTYAERVMMTGSSLRSGTSSARITVRAAPNERPVIQGLLWLSNANYWTFDGINVTWNSSLANDGEHMVRFYSGTQWIFRNAEVWGSRSYSAILVTAGASHWNLSRLHVHTTYATHSLAQDQLIYIAEARNGVIEYNLIRNSPNGRGIKLGQPKSGTGYPRNITIRYNTIVDSSAGNISLSFDTRDNQMYRNIMVNAGSAYANIDVWNFTGTNNLPNANVGWGSIGVVRTGTALSTGKGNLFIDPMLDANYRPMNPLLRDANGRIAYGHLAGT